MAVPVKLCRAHSSRTGKPCRRPAVLGATVCASHGASAPHVREAARKRLEAMILPALATVREAMLRGDSFTVRLQAARDVLDRCGFRPADLVAVDNQVTITVSYEDVGIVSAPGRSVAHQNGHHELTDGR
jgi:hypothetical protein